MARKGILAAGNWVLDTVKYIDEWPPIEGHVSIVGEAKGGGGSPFNLIHGLACLKPPFPLEALGLVGKDSAGEYIVEQCKIHGIDVSKLKKLDLIPTSYTDVITIQSTGKRTMFHNPGANAELNPTHFDPKATNCKILHLGHLLVLPKLDAPDSEYGTTAARVLAEYRKVGIKTNIDVVTELNNHLITVVKPILKHTDYCILNELESGHLVNVVTRKNEKIDLEGVKKAADELMKQGVNEWVVIHFPEGAYALSKSGKTCVQPSLNLPSGYNKGAVGAGDAFCGGVLYGLHEDWPIEECLKLAVCNAAASLSHPTATGGMKPLKETLQLARDFGFRAL